MVDYPRAPFGGGGSFYNGYDGAYEATISFSSSFRYHEIWVNPNAKKRFPAGIDSGIIDPAFLSSFAMVPRRLDPGSFESKRPFRMIRIGWV